MARLSDVDSSTIPAPAPDPNSARGIALKVIEIGQDLTARQETEPRAALFAAADGFGSLGFDEFAAAATRLGGLEDREVAAGAKEMTAAVMNLVTQLALAIHEARKGGDPAAIDVSPDAHRPEWAKHL